MAGRGGRGEIAEGKDQVDEDTMAGARRQGCGTGVSMAL